jgi:transcriptional regulator with XRE-family HTH domain
MDADEARSIGRRLRQIRHFRRKSLRVIAGLAGISPSYLSRLESRQRALDRRSLIVALANALEVAPTELTETTFPASGEWAPTWRRVRYGWRCSRSAWGTRAGNCWTLTRSRHG